MTEARVLYHVICGAGPAKRVETFIKLAQRDGWDVCCIATPSAVEHFVDVPALEQLSGHQVRVTYRQSGDETFPHANAVAVAPATYNTINKWAAGITDTYALNMLAELTGLRVPIAVLPFVNTALAANTVFTSSVAHLRREGVWVLYGEGGFQPHPPRTGESVLDTYPWHLVLESLHDVCA